MHTATWDEVVSAITGVKNRGAFSKTYTPSTSKQSASGQAGYYTSVSTACNAVSLSGNASTSQVLTGRTFYTTSLTKQTGTMANRGNLNWNPSSSTTYSVPAGYYSGGTLNSSGAYNAGINSTDRTISGATFAALTNMGSANAVGGTIVSTRTLNKRALICACSIVCDHTSDIGVNVNGGTPVISWGAPVYVSYGKDSYIRIRVNKVPAGTAFSVTNGAATSAYDVAVCAFYIYY